MRSALKDSVASALCAGSHSLHMLHDTGGNEAFGNIELFNIHAEIVICVCDGRIKKLKNGLASDLVGIFEYCGCLSNVFASDKVENDLDLAGSHTELLEISLCYLLFHYIFSFRLLAVRCLGTAVSLKVSGGSELAESVSYHIFYYIYRNVLSAVMNGDGVSYEFGEYYGSTGPSLENSLLALLVHFANSLI